MAVSAKSASKNVEDNLVTMDRRREDRRGADDQDISAMETPPRKKQRRRHIDPTTCERDYSEMEIVFMRAMDDYKRDSGRMFPTCSEVLEVIRSLGYVQLNDEQFEQLGFDQVDETDAYEPSHDECEEEFADV